MRVAESVGRLQDLCQAHDVEALLGLFAVDATLSGEGAPGITKGHENIREALAGMLEVTPKLTIEIHEHQVINDNCELTWLIWSSPDNQGASIAFRSLTVWSLVDGQWEISADFYGMGRFEKP
ncbi:nuclear transport factor 2 family protein [Pseudomonas juntendi]|uniref:Nuclear transport factor 2 family protein n=1 Tax=Pseudomonas juntendi TaxID=2666183 RepID=A0ABD4Y9K8_9PSED|nr:MULTISPECIES: nuclear transport factor 2 family protein [Pseudomonas]MDH0756167.1 nuclear transport factor 2 family protein [Pseudomonas juntendi]MDH1919851.1 nuclear transport factor 2 family protein [Pseudomonas juntendi]RRV55379.1 nuclear transport factor 2 family protein [Pseudomonas sp. p99-361]SUD79740.1 SnoaL-like domain [Pseudomonas putida]